MLTETFIQHDFNLPDHTEQLLRAEGIINNLKHKLINVHRNKTIDDKTHDNLFEEIVRMLDYVGRMSMAAFAIEDELEKMYVIQYKNSPELGKKLCSDHYENIHRPYTILKNRCFRMLDELDKEYIKTYKCKPPNWKI